MSGNKRTKGEVKQAIIREAVKAFAALGYDGVSVDELIDTLGIAKGTFYYYFKTKEDVLWEILAIGMDQLCGLIEQGLHQSDSLEQQLITIVKTEVAFFKEYSDFCLVLMGEFWRNRHSWSQKIREKQQGYVSLVQPLVQSGDMPELITAHLFWTPAALTLDWRLFHPELTQIETEMTIIRLVVGGIQPRVKMGRL